MSAIQSLFREGQVYLTEAGTETEVMYKWGFELPHFAMFTLLDNDEAFAVLTDMFRRYMDVAARYGTGMLLGGLDYRASSDWDALLGYSPEALAEMQTRCIAFLQGVRDEYRHTVPDTLVAALLGPRGDAYNLNQTITAEEAEEYHAAQLYVAKAAGADLACAATFNNVPEAVGAIRAAEAVDLPIGVYLTLDSSSRLKSGPSLREAIETIEAESGGTAIFYGLNCSHPVEYEPAIEPGAWAQRLRSIRPNASAMEKIALCELGHLEDGNPAELGKQVGDLARRLPQLDIIGGCCGTDERHLTEIARNVSQARNAA